MRKISISISFVMFLIFRRCPLSAQTELTKSDKITTFCNPLNIDYRFAIPANPVYGTAADPVIVTYKGHSQTAYANAIYMNLLNDENKAKAAQHIVDLINENDGKLSTGFLGLKPLLPSLSATGFSNEAYKLLLSKEYPSWGFEISNGANTIWERWNSYIKGQGFTNNAGMNSFNHYAFGSVNEWMFGNMAGIKVDKAGYRTFTIKPEIAREGINYVKATYHSINGEINSSWKKEGNQLQIQISVPVNTKANVFIPALVGEEVFENGQSIKDNSAFKIVGYSNGYLEIELGSGDYIFKTNV